jgi:hypothetical protein
MTRPAITVIFCCSCRESGSLTLTDGRFWCGWCQRWSEIDTERVVDSRVVLEEDSFHLKSIEPPQGMLQPLRVPNGWQIVWNTLFEEDPTEPANANGYYFGGTDLFFATHEASRRSIDIEWRTEPGQPTDGHYLLRVFPLTAPTGRTATPPRLKGSCYGLGRPRSQFRNYLTTRAGVGVGSLSTR